MLLLNVIAHIHDLVCSVYDSYPNNSLDAMVCCSFSMRYTHTHVHAHTSSHNYQSAVIGEIDEELEAEMNYSEIRAEPLNAVTH